MSKLQAFIKMEMNSYSLPRLLKRIDEMEENNLETLTLNYNIYDLDISLKEGTVSISNVLDADEDAEVIPLDIFLEAVSNFL